MVVPGNGIRSPNLPGMPAAIVKSQCMDIMVPAGDGQRCCGIQASGKKDYSAFDAHAPWPVPSSMPTLTFEMFLPRLILPIMRPST